MRWDTGYFIYMLNIHSRNNVFQLLFRTGVIPGQYRANDIIIIIQQNTGFPHTGDRYCADLPCIIQNIRYRSETMENPVPDKANIKICIFSVHNFGRSETILIN